MPLYNTAKGPVAFPDEKSIYPAFPQVSFGRAVAIGLSAGFVGAFMYVTSLHYYQPPSHIIYSMNGSNKIEQMITNRPNSYVPGRTIATHLGLSSFYEQHPDILNQVHHMGMGMIAAPIRAIMSYYGIIGPFASFVHTGIRIMMDQFVETTAGVSSPPWTWPINEQVIDVLHKGVYSLVTGYICDRLIRGVDWFNY
jgi:hypothetical protein